MGGLSIGYACGDIMVANAVGPAIIIPQIYLAGFYRPTENMPAFIRWLQWIAAKMYSFKAFLIIEMSDEENHLAHFIKEQQQISQASTADLQKIMEKSGKVMPEGLMDDFKAAISSDSAAEDIRKKLLDGFFTQNGINASDPKGDLVFYMLMPLALLMGLMIFAMVMLKISAMRR